MLPTFPGIMIGTVDKKVVIRANDDSGRIVRLLTHAIQIYDGVQELRYHGHYTLCRVPSCQEDPQKLRPTWAAASQVWSSCRFQELGYLDRRRQEGRLQAKNGPDMESEPWTGLKTTRRWQARPSPSIWAEVRCIRLTKEEKWPRAGRRLTVPTVRFGARVPCKPGTWSQHLARLTCICHCTCNEVRSLR